MRLTVGPSIIVTREFVKDCHAWSTQKGVAAPFRHFYIGHRLHRIVRRPPWYDRAIGAAWEGALICEEVVDPPGAKFC